MHIISSWNKSKACQACCAYSVAELEQSLFWGGVHLEIFKTRGKTKRNKEGNNTPLPPHTFLQRSFGQIHSTVSQWRQRRRRMRETRTSYCLCCRSLMKNIAAKWNITPSGLPPSRSVVCLCLHVCSWAVNKDIHMVILSFFCCVIDIMQSTDILIPHSEQVPSEVRNHLYITFGLTNQWYAYCKAFIHTVHT